MCDLCMTSILQEQRVQSRMIARLLDVLPSRGPDAYDDLCEALLESDHSHVADKLKQEEGTRFFLFMSFDIWCW